MVRTKRALKRGVISGGLELSHILSRLRLLPAARGRGAIFTLHHVRPAAPTRFAPNAHLEVEPAFLDAVLERLSGDGYRFVHLDEVPALLARPAADARPFAAFTLDDGYFNNLDHALPVFRRHAAPFTVFVAEGLAERRHSLWWETLSALLARCQALSFDFGEGEEHLDLASPAQKDRAFARFASFMAKGDEAAAVARLDDLARAEGLDPLQLVGDLVMDAPALVRLLSDPLARLGAHTVSHRALARLPAEEALTEMRRSADYLTERTGIAPKALAYPYGSAAAAGPREARLAERAGFALAVTTRPGCLFGAGREDLAYLPRISINGLYQKTRYVSALASGLPLRLTGG